MLKIPQKIVEQIINQAEQEAPLEACGYLGGVNGQVEAIWPMANLDKSEEHFSFDHKEQFKVVKEARQKGLGLIAVYHSHPASPARLSQEDIRLAHDSEIVYVIHSLLNNDTRGFKVDQGRITEEAIEVNQ